MSPPNKGRKFPPEPLTRAEAQRVIDAFSRRGSGGIRNAAITVVMWRCGLRIREVTDLMAKDVNLELGTIAVLHGKRDKNRLVALDGQAAAVLERWERRRRDLGISRRAPYFCQIQHPRRGRELGHSGIREALKVAAVKAGVDKRVHPHGFRHTHAFELRLEGFDLLEIKDQLGHDSLDTTARYINHLAPANRLERVSGRSWNAPAKANGNGNGEIPAGVLDALRLLAQDPELVARLATA